MKSVQRWLALGVSIALAVSLASGCNSLIGADAPTLVDSFSGSGGTGGASAQCLLNSECPNAEICVFRVCSQQCAADKDCLLGRCLPTSDGNACVVPSAATCAAASECPKGSECLRGACRTACTGDGDCLTDQTCIRGACVGNDTNHDPALGSGGAGGVGGGSAEQGGRANGGEAGATTGGSIGQAGSGEAGAAPECAPGDVSCVQLTPFSCQDGQMKANGVNCQYACDQGTCTGQCKVGTTACDGKTFETCGSDNTWQKTTCSSVCDANVGCTTKCDVNSLQCNGTTQLDICNGTTYVKKQACTSGPCALVSGVAKCVACGDSDGICPPGCTDATDVDCPKEPGETCTASTQCRAGVCGAQGVCCDSACSDSCSSCKLAGKPGICTAIDYSKSADPSNCGGCHDICSSKNITPSCTQGVCGGVCAAGFTSCNAASANDGCETNLTNDPANCNACGAACKYGECVSSVCASTKWGSTGHKDDEKFGTASLPVSLIAAPITIPTSGKLAALGVPVFFQSGDVSVHLYVALYTSSGGGTPGPSMFVAQTAELSTVNVALSGPTEGLIQPPKAISAGNYFIVVISDAPYAVQDESASTTTTIWYNSSSIPFGPFGQTLPSGLMTTTLPVPDFYAVTVP